MEYNHWYNFVVEMFKGIPKRFMKCMDNSTDALDWLLTCNNLIEAPYLLVS